MAPSPFKAGTRIAHIFQMLADGAWHCGQHELPGTQPAKQIQKIRQHGFDVEKKTIYCPTCGHKTVHRRLVSTSPTHASTTRLRLPHTLRERILAYYGHTEAITMRRMPQAQLEIDHRFPQVRWSHDESIDPYMPNAELAHRFQLLTRANNLWKSRYCEHCLATGQRGTFMGIGYFASGSAQWEPAFAADDERGCMGCFWYHPEHWRQSLNALLPQVAHAALRAASPHESLQLSFWHLLCDT